MYVYGVISMAIANNNNQRYSIMYENGVSWRNNNNGVNNNNVKISMK
jgi:hypothetical protein